MFRSCDSCLAKALDQDEAARDQPWGQSMGKQ